MEDLRSTLVAENSKVNWEPSHIREGRMGEWLKGAKDWALSRERYWGTPLPVWENEDERVVIGSLEELRQSVKKSGNVYYTLRHGDADSNRDSRISANPNDPCHLTESGKDQIRLAAEELKNKKIDLIFTSPYVRTRETTDILVKELRLAPEQVVEVDALGEYDHGIFNGKTLEEFFKAFPSSPEGHRSRYEKGPEAGESIRDLRKRTGDFLYQLENRYSDKNILIVSHGEPLWTLAMNARGSLPEESVFLPYPERGKVVPLDFAPQPHNEYYELDLHRPYIDDVVLVSKSGKEMRRVKEVMDVWLDSGAMPFAQDHYPFENRKQVEASGYPAHFISEAIDQTRGWFYTLLAVGVLLGRGAAYKNVICLGHVLDAEGKKMSKSKGNVVDPWEAMEQYGADTLRFWMYYVNQPGDPKSFDEKTVKEAARALSWLENSVKFYGLFKSVVTNPAEPQVIDRWMEARTKETVSSVTEAMDAYKPYDAVRSLAGLFEDLSQWYVRRVRDRVRDGDAAALRTLQETLRTSTLLLAPFSPFLAEILYREVKIGNDPVSVHLADWPETKKIGLFAKVFGKKSEDVQLIADMKRVRDLSSEALMLRQKVNIKVRQPLASLSIPGDLSEELCVLLAEEVNVKEVRTGALEVSLDTQLTPELVREGDIREFARDYADARKSLNLLPHDVVVVAIAEEAKTQLENIKLPSVKEVRFDASKEAQYSSVLSTGEVKFDIHAA